MPRYSDLIAQIPTGTFYSSQGSVVSNLDHPYPMRFDSLVANDIYGVFVNNVYQFEITTDADGVAIFNLSLPKGENIVTLVNRMTQQPVTTYLTSRDWATWLTAYANQLDQFDVNIETIKRNSRMAEVNFEMADPVWGRRLLNNDSPAYPIDTYREVLQEIQQGYRRFGGIVGGLDETVAAFTQVNPWICPTTFGPRWVLGTDFINNSNLEGYTFGMFVPGWPDIDPVNAGNVTVPYNQAFYSITAINQMALVWDSATRKFTYTDGYPNPISAYTSNAAFMAESGYVAKTGVFNETLNATLCTYNSSMMDWLIATMYQRGSRVMHNGIYYISLIDDNIGHQPEATSNFYWAIDTSFTRWSPVHYVYSMPGTYDTTIYNHIALDLGHGQINIALTIGAAISNATLRDDINTAFTLDPHYGNGGVYTVAYLSTNGIILISGSPIYVMPPQYPDGEPFWDAAWLIWGVPWVRTTVSADSIALPPISGQVVLSVYDASGFPTPAYVGAYSVNVIYSEATVDRRLSLPVLSIDKSANTITLDFSSYMNLAAGAIYIGSDIYPTTQTNYALASRTITSKITIDVKNTALLPIITSAPYTVTVNNHFIANPPGPPPLTESQLGIAPDGWINSADSNASVELKTVTGWMSPSALVLRTNAADDVWTLSTEVAPSIHDWACFEGEYGIWVGRTSDGYQTGGDTQIAISLEFISRIGGTISTYSIGGTITALDIAPVQIGQSILVPAASTWDYAVLSIRLPSPALGGSNAGLEIRIDEAYLKIWTHTGLNLGFNTIPRSAKRAMRGYMLYNWCVDPLLPTEKTLLGLPQYYGPQYADPPYVSSLADLRAVVATPALDAESRAVVDTRNIYQYSATTGANQPDNGNTIIKPANVLLSDNGRWWLVVYPTGHISNVSPSQVTIDRFYFDTDEWPGNLKGVFTDTDFFNCMIADPVYGVVNLDVVSRAPSRFSYLMPKAVSVVNEIAYPTINLDPTTSPTSPYMIPLTIIWDQIMDTVILYEDLNTGNGPIPIPHDVMADLGPQLIGLNFTPANGATYSIDYQRLTQINTPIMQLPPQYLLYQWWADWVTFRTLDMVPHTVPVYTGLQFDGNYYANLTVRSNMDVAQSLLLRDDGTRITPIPVTQWNYLNSYTIQIASQAFDASNTYSIQYNGLEIQPAPLPIVKVEIRQGETSAAVALAPWEILPTYNVSVKTAVNNLGVPMYFPYFQMRMSVAHITDIRFIRILSMMLKGIPVNWWGNKFIDPSMDPGPIPPPPNP